MSPTSYHLLHPAVWAANIGAEGEVEEDASCDEPETSMVGARIPWSNMEPCWLDPIAEILHEFLFQRLQFAAGLFPIAHARLDQRGEFAETRVAIRHAPGFR